MIRPVPVVLFAYARPRHLERTLGCLRENRVPLIEAFADGAKGQDDIAAVEASREQLRKIDWCDVRLVERSDNLGLGGNVLAGIEEVAARQEAFMVWEDDLICVPGTYDWLRAALDRYATEARVMSVTAWTHPQVTPPRLSDAPYFDGRAECWAWGTWSRAWSGMSKGSAQAKLEAAAREGLRPDAYGDDLPRMAAQEEERNIWAVRWLYHHFQHGGLCLRPPWSMVEHIGFDRSATNAETATAWANPPLRNAPAPPQRWPEPVEHPSCRRLWLRATQTGWRGWWPRLRRKVGLS